MFKQKHRPRMNWGSRLGLAIALAGVSGAALAGLLSAVPFQQDKSRGLPERDRLMGILPGTLARPIHLLILGIDNTAKGRATTSRFQGLRGNSDTMLLIRVDPHSPQVTLLSIPRDTQVIIRGRLSKINSANPRGGVVLVAQSVSQLLDGTRIDRYLRVDSQGFIELMNALGGVKVKIDKAMDYDDQTQKLHIHFKPGTQILNGQQLQEYIRFRKDNLGDIGRVQRQQQVLQAMLGKLWNPLTWLRVPVLLGVMQRNVDSDLALGEMLAIAQVTARTPSRDRAYFMLPGRFSSPSEYALSYWIPYPSEIKTLVTRHFTDKSGDRRSSTLFPASITIAVANGTQTPKLATKTVFFLKKQGFDQAYVTRIPDPTAYPRTQIIAQPGDRPAAEQVKRALGVGRVSVAEAEGDRAPKVTIIVGTDFADRLGR